MRHLRRALLAILLVAPASVVFAVEPAATSSSHDGGPARELVFPVVGKVSFTDTFGASRDGGKRRHEGQDLLGSKMMPLVAASDGEVIKVVYASQYGNAVVIRADDGWIYRYLHVNNDSLNTDDGQGSRDLAFGPGIAVGARVKAGQLVGFLGDSGNAEATHPHLHFELRNPDDVAVNAYNALVASTHLDAPRFLPDGYHLPPLGTSEATPAHRSTTTTSRSTSTTVKSNTPQSTTTTKPKTTSTTKKPTSTTAKPKSTTTTAKKPTSTTAKPKTTSTTAKPTSTTAKPTSTTAKPATTTTSSTTAKPRPTSTTTTTARR